MAELLAVTCDSCGEPMVPNVSTLDDDGCGWICLSPGCPELAAGELEAEDLVEAGVPEALAGRLARLVDHYVDAEEARGREADAPARARERAQADLARLHALLLELGRLAEGAGALAAHLSDALVVSYHRATSPRPSKPARPSPPSAPSAPSSAAPPATPRTVSPASTPSCRDCSTARRVLRPGPPRIRGGYVRLAPLTRSGARRILCGSPPASRTRGPPGVAILPGVSSFLGANVNRVVYLCRRLLNLYHSLREAERSRGRSLRWLDLSALCSSLLHAVPGRSELAGVVYFSALARHMEAARPGTVARHLRYLDALQATGVETVLSQFKRRQVRCPYCGRVRDRWEEKQTDVGIAVRLMKLAAVGACERVFVVSGDTDLVPATRRGPTNVACAHRSGVPGSTGHLPTEGCCGLDGQPRFRRVCTPPVPQRRRGSGRHPDSPAQQLVAAVRGRHGSPPT